MKSMYPSIAVIGSKGYLGSRLLQNLNQFFDNVEGIDQHNLAQLEDCLKRNEMIIWAAGLSNHELGKQDPWLDMQLNAIDVIRATSHVTTSQTLIHISSTCIYGNSAGVVNEESQVMPLEPQAYSKFYAEEMLTHIAKIRGFTLLNLRSSAVVGDKLPGEPLSFLEKVLISDAKNEVIEIYGGKQRPCIFTPINDFLSCIKNLLTLENWPSHKLNLATHQVNFDNLTDQFKFRFVDSKIRNSLKIENKKWGLLNLKPKTLTNTLNYLDELQNELRKRFII
tara:strand:- start:2285 stop:3124 length:840 start_codon:yes stop_codon:yes gene_type:complete